MTITKKRVEEIISRVEMYGHGAGYAAEEVYDLAVLALNLSNIEKLKRYELDMSGCDSCGQDCGADMAEDPDGEFVMFDDVVNMFQFETTSQQFESVSNHNHAPLIENGQLVADTLRHLANNEIDSDYFAITSTNENGTEIDHEMAITDYALQAAGTVDELIAELKAAEKRIAELSASHSKLRGTMAGIHNKIRMDGGYTPLAAILNAAKRAYEESASAAGIRIKGE